MPLQEFRQNLTNNIKEYHKILEDFGCEIYDRYKKNPQDAARFLLGTICLPRSVHMDFIKKGDMNTGSVGGIVIEWTFYHLIDSMLKREGISDIKVINGYKLPYKWKKEGNKKLNIDIAVGIDNGKPGKLKRLLYLVELKTNFEDGFIKYCDQQRHIYHHRTRNQPDFKYHYIAFSKIPKYIKEKYDSELRTMSKRKQLWCFPILDKLGNLSEANIRACEENAAKLLRLFYRAILDFKKR
jgi:hypothetical protein